MTQDYNPYGASQQPGQPFGDYGNPPPKKSKASLIIGIVLGSIAVLTLCCCGGFFGLMQIGQAEMNKQVQADFGNHPTVVQHIGANPEMEFSWSETTSGTGEMVFVLTGGSGSGKLLIDEAPAGGYNTADLVLPNGDTHDLLNTP